MNFLEIVKEVGDRSNTVDSRTITTVETSGLVATIASLTRSAWVKIQNSQPNWRFRVVDLPPSATFRTGIPEASPSTLGLTGDGDAPAWSEWVAVGGDEGVQMSTWAKAEAGEDPVALQAETQRALVFISNQAFERRYRFGEQGSNTTPGQPQVAAVDLQDRIVLWPVPDRDYFVRGAYRRAAQRLAKNDDVPIIMEDYQELIIWAGVIALHENTEAEVALIQTARQEVADHLSALRRRYLQAPTLRFRPLGQRTGGNIGAGTQTSVPSVPGS